MGLPCSVALVALLTGNAAAVELAGDHTGTKAPLVTPKLDPRNGLSQHLKFKLATTTGHDILMYG